MAKTTGKRTVMILFRVTQNEYEVIKKKSAASGMSMSEFIRKTLMGKKIVSAPPADFPFLIREIKRVGNNLNQVLRRFVLILELRAVQETGNKLRRSQPFRLQQIHPVF